MAQVLAAGSGSVASAIERRIGGRSRPWNARADRRNVGEDGGLHDFEVLLVLSGRARRNFIEPFSCVGPVDSAEAVEGGEELIAKGEEADYYDGEE